MYTNIAFLCCTAKIRPERSRKLIPCVLCTRPLSSNPSLSREAKHSFAEGELFPSYEARKQKCFQSSTYDPASLTYYPSCRPFDPFIQAYFTLSREKNGCNDRLKTSALKYRKSFVFIPPHFLGSKGHLRIVHGSCTARGHNRFFTHKVSSAFRKTKQSTVSSIIPSNCNCSL